MENNILYSIIQYIICGLILKLEKNSHYIDDYVFRCRSNVPKHDIKVNIRKYSIFENMKMEINTMYYLISKCFLKNKSLDSSYDNIHYFCSILGNPLQTKKAIVRLYFIMLFGRMNHLD